MRSSPHHISSEGDVTSDPKTAVSFVFSQLVCQAVTFELQRLAGIKPPVDTTGESSKPKSEDLLPENLAGKVFRTIYYGCTMYISI